MRKSEAELDHKKPARRIRALRALASLEPEGIDDPERLARALLARLEDEDARVHTAALEAIGALSHRGLIDVGERGLDEVLRLAESIQDEVRAEVAVVLTILGAQRPDRVRLPITKLLEDDSPIVRREAAAALGDLGEVGAAAALATRLEDEDEEARFEVAYALAQLGDARGLDELVRALAYEPRRIAACEGIRRVGDQRAVEPLRKLMGAMFAGWPDRLTAAATLYSLGVAEGGDAVLEKTSTWNRGERAYAIELVGRHGIEGGRPTVVEVAERAKDPARAHAIRALGDLGEVALLREIAERSGEPDEIRDEAKRALDDARAKRS